MSWVDLIWCPSAVVDSRSFWCQLLWSLLHGWFLNHLNEDMNSNIQETHCCIELHITWILGQDRMFMLAKTQVIRCCILVLDGFFFHGHRYSLVPGQDHPVPSLGGVLWNAALDFFWISINWWRNWRPVKSASEDMSRNGISMNFSLSLRWLDTTNNTYVADLPFGVILPRNTQEIYSIQDGLLVYQGWSSNILLVSAPLC